MSTFPNDGPADDAFVITKSDTANFSKATRAIYVGGTGDITLVTAAGTTVLFSALPAGSLLPIKALRVNSTATTATLMIGLI